MRPAPLGLALLACGACAAPGERVFGGAVPAAAPSLAPEPGLSPAVLPFAPDELDPVEPPAGPLAGGRPAAGAAPPAGAWSLEDVLNRALDANRGLLDARSSVVSSRYQIAAARAPFELRIFPATSATVTGGTLGGGDLFGLGVSLEKRFETGTQVAVTPELRRFDESYQSVVTTNVRQPLLRGTDSEFVLASVDAAAFSSRSARRALYRTRVDTVVAAVAATYQLVRQREFLRLNEDSVRRLEGHAEAARARERAGIASSLDVYRATLQYNRARDSLENARESYDEALDSLRILLALDLWEPLAVDAPLAYDLVRISEGAAVATALDERIELDQARDALAEAERRSRVARHGTEPDLDLVVSWSQLGTAADFDRSLDLDDSAVSVSLVTSSDLARTAEFARYGQALLDVEAARRSLEFQRDQVVRQVRGDLRDLARLEKRIALQEEQIGQAGGKLELARVKFSRGLASNFDVIEAESELRSAQTDLVTAVIDYIVGTYRLRASLGTLLEKGVLP